MKVESLVESCVSCKFRDKETQKCVNKEPNMDIPDIKRIPDFCPLPNFRIKKDPVDAMLDEICRRYREFGFSYSIGDGVVKITIHDNTENRGDSHSLHLRKTRMRNLEVQRGVLRSLEFDASVDQVYKLCCGGDAPELFRLMPYGGPSRRRIWKQIPLSA